MAQDSEDTTNKIGDPNVAMKDDVTATRDGVTANEVIDLDVDMSDEAEEDEEGEEEEDPLLKFQNVMTAIDIERLKSHAVELRIQQSESQGLDSSNLSCEILEPSLHGSYNLVYVIQFSDAVKWVARLPIQGTRCDEEDRDKLDTDYSTLRYIRKEFSIPTPQVFTWETTCDRIGVPFALMSFESGERLDDLWFDKSFMTEEKRLKILTNLAHIMAKLQQPKFNRIGTLRFRADGSFSHIGPMHTIVEDEDEYLTAGILYVGKVGPYETREDYLFDGWDTFEDLAENLHWQKGCLEVMKLAIQSIPAFLRQPNGCEITFWDYNYQNILIDDDCNITSILDWDGIRAVPQGQGCTRYPSWLTRDWDPAVYEPPIDGDWEAIEEDPPEKLTKYRKHYADTFASLSLPDYDPRQTKLSHILEAISIGSGNRFPRKFIMRTLLDHAYGGEKNWPWEYMEINKTLMDPSTEAAKSMSKDILKQFESMWHAEWETPDMPIRKRDSQGARLRLLSRFWPAPKADSTTDRLAVVKNRRQAQSTGRSFSRFFSAMLKR